MKCSIHLTDARWVKAGSSKKTGKPYDGFWACETEKGCRGPFVEKEIGETAKTPTRFIKIEDCNSNRDNSILWQVAFKGAVEVAAQASIELKSIPLYTEQFYTLLKRGSKAEVNEEAKAQIMGGAPATSAQVKVIQGFMDEQGHTVAHLIDAGYGDPIAMTKREASEFIDSELYHKNQQLKTRKVNGQAVNKEEDTPPFDDDDAPPF